ncbi:MAG: NAD+ synthase [Pseudomonadota bacterium]|nr:NAD+ synthase [Pseudomonadota bacterium]
MTDRLNIALAQLNPVVGDVGGNATRLLAARDEAAAGGADLVVFSELVLIGYPPEDLVLKPALQDLVERTMAELAEATGDGGPAMVVGAPLRENGSLYNAAFLLHDGAVTASRKKYDLPNYGVFDEKRLFAAGPLNGPLDFKGVRLGVMVCEDMWAPDVTECLEESGAEILMVLNGSPFETDKPDDRLNLAVARITESGLPLVYVNQVGGQDELVFDGASFVLDAACNLRAQAPAWREAVTLTQWRDGNDGRWTCEEGPIAKPEEGLAAVYQAMTTGLRDYVAKNRFKGVVIGLSGGIDSALSAAVAVDALGAEAVHCVMMPSRYTSQASLDDAAACAGLLGVRLDSVPIEPGVGAFDTMLQDMFAGLEPDVTEENIQARLRGLLLMAISNKLGHMVLTTGNKSEMSVGYATLYGDMCGGYSVLKDVYKTGVFALSRWRNQSRPDGAAGPKGRVIPEAIIDKPPTAELRPDQLDQDSLPPYDELDDILKHLIEHEDGIDDIAARGFDATVVRRVSRMLDLAEYKRRQAPPGVKITSRAFGRDRRYPITNRFRYGE